MDILQTTREIAVTLDLKEIDEKPGPYCMSFGFDLRPLIHSIEKFGLINQPIVRLAGEGRIDVVAGYRRILALKSIQWEKVPCRDLSNSGLSTLELLLFNFYDNLSTRRFNEVEKGMILNLLIPLVPRKEIIRHYMPLLDLPSHESTLDIFLKLEELENPVRTSLIERHISFHVIKAFVEMDRDARSAIFRWISNIKFNFNQQIQFIEYSFDISIKEERRISELLNEKEFLRIAEDKKLNNPQKAKRVLDLLRSRRFPLLSGSEKAFQKNISNLGLPEGVRVYHPPFFEGPDYRLEILFRDGKELKTKINSLWQLNGLEGIGHPWQED